MNMRILAVLMVMLMGGGASAAPAPLYENFGVVGGAGETPEMIDALIFVNHGIFNVSASLPYDFESTRSFTNNGVMNGTIGFRFETASSTGGSVAAENFVNLSGAVIRAVDFLNFSPIGPGLGDDNDGDFGGIESPDFGGLMPSYLLISADSVRNQGRLSAGNAGLLRIEGRTVDLTRGGLEIRPIEAFAISTLSNFYPEPGIFDRYWGMTNSDGVPMPALAGRTSITRVAISPYAVTNRNVFNPFETYDRMTLQNPVVYVYTNKVTPTNYLVQAIFVSLGDTNITVDARFADSDIATNVYKTASIELSMLDTNIVTGDEEYSRLYLTDRLASFTNYVILTNMATLPLPTGRPSSYDLVRTIPPEFETGFKGRGELTPPIYALLSTNATVTNFYAAYLVDVDSQAVRAPQVAGLELTDSPGRIEIVADDLDLTRSRIRGSGLVSIQSSNLLSTSRTLIDSENVSYNLSTRSGKLRVVNLMKEEARRLNGTLRAWSGIWTNLAKFAVTNIVVGTAADGGGTAGPTTTTNLEPIEVTFHFMVVDATDLRTTKPVQTHDLVIHSADVVMEDSARVVRSLLINSERFTMQGNLRLGNRLEHFTPTNAPNLKFFTNNGIFEIPNTADFGYTRAEPYSALVNSGTIAATGIRIRSGYFENSGSVTTSADGITLESPRVILQEGKLEARGFLKVSATDMRMAFVTNSTAGSMELNVTGSLTDSAEPGSNLLLVGNGFHMTARPTSGDLLGTTLQSVVGRFRSTDHTWAAQDRGATQAGFVNNLVLERLVLDGDRESLHRFAGLTAGSGLYVTFLELANSVLDAFDAGDLASALEVDPNLVIYFADASVPPEQLDGLLADEGAPQGRLRWVRDVTVGLSGVDVVSRSANRTVKMNRGVRESYLIDSDRDGIVNALDSFPLDSDRFQLSVRNGSSAGGESVLALTWEALGSATYVVEYTTDLATERWLQLDRYTNTAKGPQTVTLDQRVSTVEGQRYYRVRLVQQ
jgi:hypothetical protein